MHSSMKALRTKKPPEYFLRALIQVLGPDGTLLLPALTYQNVTEKWPYFHVRDSEPCIGLLPRTFQRMKGVRRSLHPTHSVCATGRLAETLTKDHIRDDTPVGPNSPFMRLPEHGGKLLFVGNVLNACTFMHGIEEIVGAPYALKKERTRYHIRDDDGQVHVKDYITHDFESGPGWNQAYYRIRELLAYPDIRSGKVGAAVCTLIDAAKLKEAALARFKEDMYAFVIPIDEGRDS